MNEKHSEMERLKSIAEGPGYDDGSIDGKIHSRMFHIFSECMRDGATLEIGPAEGLVTGLIADKTQDLTALEPTASMADNLEKRFSKVSVERELVEQWMPKRRFDNIFMMYVLEHVLDAAHSLQRVSGWLADGGRLFVAVPNAMSLHRQAGVEMGILENTNSPSERDLMLGHRRVYTLTTLIQDIESTGLSIVKQGGVFIKIASIAQIKQWNWNGKLLDALLALGERYPQIASDIYAVAEKN